MLKKIKKILITMIFILFIVISICLLLKYFDFRDKKEMELRQKEISKDTISKIPDEYKTFSFNVKKEDGSYVFQEVVYDGLTYDELVSKINRSLNSTLSSKGNVYVDNCLKYGIDPYLAVAISLYETGCKWTCSYLTRECNNVGGIKGFPGCDGGSFKYYPTIDDGIKSFIELIYEGYYSIGLTNAELMGYKYANGSETWASRVNAYIDEIKAK